MNLIEELYALQDSVGYLRGEDLRDLGRRLKVPLHEIEGRVVWCRRLEEGGKPHAPGMGVQFTDSLGCAKLARELEDMLL